MVTNENVILVDLTEKQRNFLKGKALQHFREGGLDCKPEDAFDKLANWYAQYHASIETETQAENQIDPMKPVRIVRRPEKGLILFGTPGCGKTSVSRLLKRGPVFEGTNIPRWAFPMFHAYNIVEEYTDGGPNWWLPFQQRYGRYDLVLDDIGSEENARWMGRSWTLATFLKWRYDCWANYGALTILTTNSESVSQLGKRYVNWIEDRYDAKDEFNRVVGRVLEMTESIHYANTSRRPDPKSENIMTS